MWQVILINSPCRGGDCEQDSPRFWGDFFSSTARLRMDASRKIKSAIEHPYYYYLQDMIPLFKGVAWLRGTLPSASAARH